MELRDHAGNPIITGSLKKAYEAMSSGTLSKKRLKKGRTKGKDFQSIRGRRNLGASQPKKQNRGGGGWSA